MPFLWTALGVAPLLIASRPASALELWGTGPLANASLQMSGDFELRYNVVDDRLGGDYTRLDNGFPLVGTGNVLDYWEQVNRLNALLTKNRFSAGVQVDEVALFGNRYLLDGQLEEERTLYEPGQFLSPWPDALVLLEKAWIEQRGTWGEVTLGDTYASFGRGIALNIVKNTDIDVDTSIRGFRSVLRQGDLEATLISGLSNTQQVSQQYPNIDISKTAADMITGLRLEDYGVGPAQVGAHGVLYKFGRSDPIDSPGILRYTEPVDAVVGGLMLSAPSLGGMHWYLEGDTFSYRATELGASTTASGEVKPLLGYAVYGSAVAYAGNTTVLVEGKRTKDTAVLNTFATPDKWQISTPPTLEYERVITEDAQAAVSSNDIGGGRIRIDQAMANGRFTPYISFMALRDLDTGGLHFNRTPETVGHAITGLQWFGKRRVVQVNTGFREDRRDDPAAGADRLAHFDGEVELPVGKVNQIEFNAAVRRFWWGNNPQQQSDYTEMENSVGWHQGEKWILLLYQDYSDNPLVQSAGNITGNLYGAVEVRYKARGDSEFRLFYGAYKAGIRCSGGQCRTLPGFKGVRFSWQGNF